MPCSSQTKYATLNILLAFIGLLMVSNACKTSAPVPAGLQLFEPGRQAKNIILLIGDGMGLTQISAALYSNNNQLAMLEMPVVGFHKSHSADNLITDSAAGATAFACGVKTYNGAIGLNADTVACYSILAEAKSKGMATGLIATSTIIHATPAAFYAHQDSRIAYEDIASDLVAADVDLFIGGGSQYFIHRVSDKRDLYEELRLKGYYVSDHSAEDVLRAPFNPQRGFAFLTAESQPGAFTQGRTYLPLSTRYALQYLARRNSKGFFIMIEGSQIDWKCHQNDAREAIREILDFDAAVREALEFAKGRDDTLVIVTADHETGGMAIQPGSRFGRLKIAFTTNSHTAALVPVLAYGPSAELFSGIYENTGIHTRMRQALGFQALSSAKER